MSQITILLYNMPQSMENYYQEAGRAGRDGENADCVLLYSPQDVMINQFLLDNKEVRYDMDEDETRAVRERDIQRLRNMTYYCTTKECLRSYILRYFGENVYSGCGNLYFRNKSYTGNKTVKEFIGGEKKQLYYEPVHEEGEKNDSVSFLYKLEKRSKKKENFQLTSEMENRIVYLPECTITELSSQLNELRDEKIMKKTSGAAINRMLASHSYLEERYIDGIWRKVILEKGKEIGIFSKMRISEKGNEYEVLFYSEEAQRKIAYIVFSRII